MRRLQRASGLPVLPTHGVGVERAGGLDQSEAPELRASGAGRVATKSLPDAARGVWHTVQDMADGEIAPALLPQREHARPRQPVAAGGPLPTD